MKKLLLLALTLLSGQFILAQTCEDYAVEITATTQTTPPKITLHWKRISGVTRYELFKKSISSSSWGTVMVTLTVTDSTYTDAAVVADSAYEYKIKATGSSLTSVGYIYASIANPAIHNRGGLVLIVDTTFVDSCRDEIYRLMKDMSGDGWSIYRHDVGRSIKDTAVKNLIKADYTAHSDIKSVLLLGHVAVPYSGRQNPDGHPDHIGAWPADAYYGALTMSWTDLSVNDTSSSYPANRNRIGDGKWDQVSISGLAELSVGRVDFYNMPAFSATEVQMMRRYLNKDHTYKMDSLNVRKRGIISDNFGAFSGEAFAANAWRNFPPMITHDSINNTSPLINTLDTAFYQWSYGTGGGSFTSASGVGNTNDFAAKNVNTIFMMLFGSYFGDWNVTNSFLRAPLCSATPALTNCWAGRPNWFLHHMALGHHIGYSALLTLNNQGGFSGVPYEPTGIGPAFVHIALLGDVSLRTDYMKRASNVTITKVPGRGATINWTASAASGVLGYYVYRANSEFGTYQRLSGMITGTTFRDSVGTTGLKYYQVRPVRLEVTPSGSYYNLGIGIGDSASLIFPNSVAELNEVSDINIFPNPTMGNLYVEVNALQSVTAEISILNTLGQRCLVQNVDYSVGRNQNMLSVGHLPTGVYVLMISTPTGTMTRKWLKS